MAGARQRIVLCTGQYCNLGRRADRLHRKLTPLVMTYNNGQRPPPCKLETANCLSMCATGPNLIIYPGEKIYNDVQEDQIEAIFHEHIDRVAK
ncbi:MAG: (2Fe-2S) ferredoxin domain-containing protein [Chloroflexi bacterium]|nr:(2Fe-2S) ferredoxin domain-containing protein [Chloroflexota bacterium]